MKIIKEPYSRCDMYDIDIEIADNNYFLHIKVKQWNKGVLKWLRLELDELLLKAHDKNLDYLYTYTQNPKTIKFAKLLKDVDLEADLIGVPGGKLLGWEV